MDSLTFADGPTFPEGKRPWGADVEKVNAYWFYDLGRDLRTIGTIPDGSKGVDVVFPLLNARWRMKKLVDESDPIPLGVSLTLARAVHQALEEALRAFEQDTGSGQKEFKWPTEDMIMPPWAFASFRYQIERFETVFSAEMAEAATYFVPRRGIYNTAALVDSAEETFPPEVRGAIPKKSLTDWRAAGRCLAFNLCSASGYHVARAVEGTIEAYYQAFTGKPGTLRSWHDYIQALEAVKGGPKAPKEKTIAEIQQMKDDYRNPLMHPRVVLDEAEARILFANGESLIMSMASEIKAHAPPSSGMGPVTALLSEGSTP